MNKKTPVFEPKLLTVFKEGYGAKALRRDILAGLTVAVVALPLSMAIAIASGLPPETGLITAIVGGFFVSALGGSRFQIGGPAGAFIVPVATTLAAHGLEGLVLATFLSGVFLTLAGLLRLGRFVRLIPDPAVLGFSAGIALIIAASQIHDLFGLVLAGKEPAELLPKLAALFAARETFNPEAPVIAAACIAIILGLRRINPNIPGMLIAVFLSALTVFLFDLPVETLGERFGELKGTIPAPAVPVLSWEKIAPILPSALSFTLLGAIESLLSATVADSMTNRRHRPEAELVAQGVANVAASLFGGFCVTGTIARTATNVRAGAHGPVSGILHAVFVLIVLLAAMPLAAHIPFAALAGVLMVVAFNMVERHKIGQTLRESRAGALALALTLVLTVTVDLTVGIASGCLVMLAARVLKGQAKRG